MDGPPASASAAAARPHRQPDEHDDQPDAGQHREEPHRSRELERGDEQGEHGDHGEDEADDDVREGEAFRIMSFDLSFNLRPDLNPVLTPSQVRSALQKVLVEWGRQLMPRRCSTNVFLVHYY